MKTFFFLLENTCACVLGPWPWPRAFLSLASRVSVLEKAVLGLGFFFMFLALASSLVSSTPPLVDTGPSNVIGPDAVKSFFCRMGVDLHLKVRG